MSDSSEEDTHLTDALSALRDELGDGAGDGFTASLHRRLVEAGAPPALGWAARCREWMDVHPVAIGTGAGVFAGAGMAAAMFLTVFAAPESPLGHDGTAPRVGALAQEAPACAVDPVSGGEAPVRPAAMAVTEVFVVPVGKVAMVQLNFTLQQGVEMADFNVMLPDGLSFFSEGQPLQTRSFQWQAPLDAGDNPVTVAILGQRPGVHRLMATATVAGEVVVHEVVLHVREAA